MVSDIAKTFLLAMTLCGAWHSVEAEDTKRPSGIDFDAIVAFNFERGYSIAVAELTYIKNFSASLGEDGKKYRIEPGCKVLLVAKDAQYSWQDGKIVGLFYRYPKETKVILVEWGGGHWMDYTEENEKRILEAVEKVKQKAADKAKRP